MKSIGFVLIFFLDIILFLVSIAVFSIFIRIGFLLWTYKHIVLLVGNIRGYGLIPIYGLDSGFSIDTFAKPGIGERMGSNPKLNVAFLLRIPGNQSVSVKWIRGKFETSFLKMDQNGEPVHPRLFSYLVQFGGYAFQKRVSSIDIEYHIQEVTVPSHQSLQTYLAELIAAPYEPNKPFWKLLLFPSPDIENEVIVVFKFYHGLGDVYTAIHILDTLTDTVIPYKVEEFEESIWDKVSSGINRFKNSTYDYNTNTKCILASVLSLSDCTCNLQFDFHADITTTLRKYSSWYEELYIRNRKKGEWSRLHITPFIQIVLFEGNSAEDRIFYI